MRPAPIRALERAIPWLAAVVVALPVLAGGYPPMIDLPCHEEIVAAMRYFGDEGRYPAGLMTWNVGHPNQLFYFAAYALAFAMPVSTACKAVVAGSVAGVPLAAGRLADHLGTSRWAALAAAPLGIGFFFYFGFVGNLLGLGLLLASLPAFDRLACAPSPSKAGRAVLLLVVLYAAHDSALFIGCIAIAILSAGRPVVRRATLWRVAPIAAGAGIAALEFAIAVRRPGAGFEAVPRVIDLAAWQKFDAVPQALLGLHGARTTALPFVLLVVVVTLCGLERIGRIGHPPRVLGFRGHVDQWRFELLAVVLLAAYFVVPFAYSGAMWLGARFLGPGVAVLIVALSPRRPSAMQLAVNAIAIGAVALMLRLVGSEITATGSLYGELELILAKIAPRSAVASLDLSGGPRRGLVFAVGGAASRAATERGGRMAASFTQASPIPPVVLAREHRWDDALARLFRDSMAFEPEVDFHRFRYVIAWAPGQTEVEAVTRALDPEARLVARSAGWLLFESTLQVESLLAPEAPTWQGETVRSRMGRPVASP
jgi:hypothetical protein